MTEKTSPPRSGPILLEQDALLFVGTSVGTFHRFNAEIQHCSGLNPQMWFLSGALLELPTATLHISAENFCFAASNSGNNFSKMVGMSIRLVATDKLMAAIV